MVWEEDSEAAYSVIINCEEQYSLWPNWKAVPYGWRMAGKAGTKAECVAYINEVWTDMRPLSLCRQMQEGALAQEPSHEPANVLDPLNRKPS
jgi:MbtH protein